MYTILYIQITQNFKECTQFSMVMVHFFSKKKCTQLYTFNVHNFFYKEYALFYASNMHKFSKNVHNSV